MLLWWLSFPQQLEKVTAQSLDTPALQILIDGKTQIGDLYKDITYDSDKTIRQGCNMYEDATVLNIMLGEKIITFYLLSI